MRSYMGINRKVILMDLQNDILKPYKACETNNWAR